MVLRGSAAFRGVSAQSSTSTSMRGRASYVPSPRISFAWGPKPGVEGFDGVGVDVALLRATYTYQCHCVRDAHRRKYSSYFAIRRMTCCPLDQYA